jgi:hypothetical protein
MRRWRTGRGTDTTGSEPARRAVAVLPSPYTGAWGAADKPRVTTAVAALSRDAKSFRLSKPVAAEFTACTFLALAASGIWLFVLPLELLRLVSA